jgi:SAM-dependent methyltransferase
MRMKAYQALWHPSIRRRLVRLPLLRRIYDGWARVHPFDQAYAIDTSGMVSSVDLVATAARAERTGPYGGSQPSIVRAALNLLPAYDSYTFVDIGCGKGRVLVVASEYRFDRIIGREISPELARIAQANAETIAVHYPRRTCIEVELGDALAAAPPGGNVVYFTYHPFDRSLMRALVANIEGTLQNSADHVFFVYYNPVHSDVLDQSEWFERWAAVMSDYAPDEVGFGPDLRDTVVIWQRMPAQYPARPGANARIVADDAGGSAHLGSGQPGA